MQLSFDYFGGEPYKKCKVDKCTEKYFAAGYCGMHYHRERRGAPLNTPKRGTVKCMWPGCDENTRAKGFCNKHYPMTVYLRPEDRFKGKTYELKISLWMEMLINQNGLCFLCDKQMTGTMEPQVDHCHETGKIRGLLCWECNVALGTYEKLLIRIGKEKIDEYLGKK